ncbi:hypothetical protein [Streptomonospora litoralis]|uniref:Uncharacterized protein n=1 Tax=Streptomonospora litoralis TaxID=2498135 RepID=A0A4P6QB01_9ACTN|nr:hypothetical protein [Streptomonospora litoralis]QBI56819.1 hypothetical protein EKD16_25395 [Streptomonospora litoralis]
MDCENCNAREAVATFDVGDVETALCHYCAGTPGIHAGRCDTIAA